MHPLELSFAAIWFSLAAIQFRLKWPLWGIAFIVVGLLHLMAGVTR